VADDDRPAQRNKCFVVSAFGDTPTDVRFYAQVLKYLIKPVLEPGYDVKRADELNREGLITNQIIERLREDDLVIADYTGRNPNVFYEVAARHSFGKPIVHLCSDPGEIPFDVANQRAIPYSLLPEPLEEAKLALGAAVKAIEDVDFRASTNPITSVVNVATLQQSAQLDVRETAAVLHAINELRDELRTGRRPDLGNVGIDSSGGVRASGYSMDTLSDLEKRVESALFHTPGALAIEQLYQLIGEPANRAAFEDAVAILSNHNRIVKGEDGRLSQPI
jgi:hypothetical protein